MAEYSCLLRQASQPHSVSPRLLSAKAQAQSMGNHQHMRRSMMSWASSTSRSEPMQSFQVLSNTTKPDSWSLKRAQDCTGFSFVANAVTNMYVHMVGAASRTCPRPSQTSPRRRWSRCELSAGGWARAMRREKKRDLSIYKLGGPILFP